MDTFRILHLSDLHIARRPRVLGFPDFLNGDDFPDGQTGLLSASSWDPHLADLVARQVFLRRQELDLILATGDEATTGGEHDLIPAVRYFDLPAMPGGWWSDRSLPTLRHADGPPIVLMPGNHDRFDGMLMSAGGTRFDQHFGSYWNCARGVQTMAVLEGAGGDKFAVVGADFCLARNRDAANWFGHFGQGYAYPDLIRQLVTHTKQIRAQHGQVAVCWAIHFPPYYNRISKQLRLLNEQALPQATQSAGVSYIFAGHSHAQCDYPVPPSGLMVLCAGTATQYYASKANAIHLREFDVQGGNIVANRNTHLVWDQQSGDFKKR